MNEILFAKINALDEMAKKIADDEGLRRTINRDPIAYLKTLNIEVESKFATAVTQGIKAVTVGPGSAPDLTAPAERLWPNNIDPSRRPPAPPSNLQIIDPGTPAQPVIGQDFAFNVTEWGLILTVPEEKVQLIKDGGLTVVELGGALMSLLVAAGGIAASCPPLAVILGIAGLFCGIQATWLLAEIALILALDSIHHQGVYLVWNWVGMALMGYLPIPVPIT